MQKTKKQIQEKDKKKRRKILLATLIPVGVAAAALGITLPLVLTKKAEDVVKLTLVWNEVQSSYCIGEFEELTFKKDQKYEITANVDKSHHQSPTQSFNALVIYNNASSKRGTGFDQNFISGTFNNDPATLIVDPNNELVTVGELASPMADSGVLKITFTWKGKDFTGSIGIGSDS